MYALSSTPSVAPAAFQDSTDGFCSSDSKPAPSTDCNVANCPTLAPSRDSCEYVRHDATGPSGSRSASAGLVDASENTAGRLGDGLAWTTVPGDTEPWYQIDMLHTAKVGGIVIDDGRRGPFWDTRVTRLSVSVSADALRFEPVPGALFERSAEAGPGLPTESSFRFGMPILARAVRVYVLSWNGNAAPSMRLGLLLCSQFIFSASLTPCSATCGDGVQAIVFRCVRAGTPALPAAPSDCSSTAVPPNRQTEACNARECPQQYSYIASIWSGCSATCGVAFRSRRVDCTRNFQVVSVAECEALLPPAPTNSERCYELPACVEPTEFAYEVSYWMIQAITI